MRLAIVLAALASLGITPAAAAQGWVGQPPVSAEVQGALARARSGEFSELLRLAETGRADAQFYAGTIMIFGANGAPKDGPRGCALLARAAVTRADAQHMVGECLQYGYGGERDLEKAMAAFDKAGDMGFPKSRCAEGNVLIQLNREQPRAVSLCQQGAEAGDADAQTDLGNFYLKGQGVERDVAKARGWYEKAAAQGQRNAAYTLGQIYWNGDGVPKDNAMAGRLWRMAYDGGRTDAAFWLGNEAFVRAQRGERVWDIAGLEEAAGWYDLAAKLPDPKIANDATERALLMRQMQDVMRRRQKP